MDCYSGSPVRKHEPKIDAYIAKAAPFARPIIEHLREVVHAACPEVEENDRQGEEGRDPRPPGAADDAGVGGGQAALLEVPGARQVAAPTGPAPARAKAGLPLVPRHTKAGISWSAILRGGATFWTPRFYSPAWSQT